MTIEQFIESGMTFGPYPNGNCFRIEQSDTYYAIQDSVQMAEFLLLVTQAESPPVIWIVEAKSSSPQLQTQPRFNEFICEIRDKLANALMLGVACILKRHPQAVAELPGFFKTIDLATVGFRLVLIINGHQKAWLPPLQEALRSALRTTTQTWALGPNAVVVLNHEEAKRRGLISAP